MGYTNCRCNREVVVYSLIIEIVLPRPHTFAHNSLWLEDRPFRHDNNRNNDPYYKSMKKLKDSSKKSKNCHTRQYNHAGMIIRGYFLSSPIPAEKPWDVSTVRDVCCCTLEKMLEGGRMGDVVMCALLSRKDKDVR